LLFLVDVFSWLTVISVADRYQQCHCLAPIPAKISTFNSHMQGSHLVISNKPRFHNEVNRYPFRTIKTGRRQRGASGALTPHLKSVPLFHVWSPVCCIHPIFFLNVAPLWFLTLRCEILATGLNANPENLSYEQKHMSVLILFETIIKC